VFLEENYADTGSQRYLASPSIREKRVHRRSGSRYCPYFASFARPKHLELLNPEIQADIHEGKHGNVLVTLTARHPALWAWLDLKNTDVRFSDNFFHLPPGKPVTIELFTKQQLSAADIRAQLQVRSLFDTYS
jgi:beta-mannosidase